MSYYERYEGDAIGRESAPFLGFSGRKKIHFSVPGLLLELG